MNKEKLLEELSKELIKDDVMGQGSLASAGSKWDVGEDVEVYPGMEVAITHQLAPSRMKLTIGTSEKDIYKASKHYDTKYYDSEGGYKYVFHYRYLDLAFIIKTDDDKVAAKLYPYFNEKQKVQIMAMTLGSKSEE